MPFRHHLKSVWPSGHLVVAAFVTALMALSAGADQPAEVIVATYDMENGVMPGSPKSTAYRAKVPIELLQESNGNHFIRITGSPEDQFSTAGSRSEVNIAYVPSWCSNSAHRSMTLEMSVRMPNDSTRPSNTGVLQFFQYGGAQYGPTLRLLWNERKGFYLRKQTSEDPRAGTYPVGSTLYVEEYEEIRLGRVGIGQWVHFQIGVYWTLDRAEGEISVRVNGELEGTMRGQTIKNVKSNCTSDSRIGTYSGAGVVDFDNLEMRVGASGPTPSSSKFRIGDRVAVHSGPIAYRSTPAGAESGTQALNAQGTVVGGPMYATLSGVKHWWWNIKFDNGFPGWVTEGPLEKARTESQREHLKALRALWHFERLLQVFGVSMREDGHGRA